MKKFHRKVLASGVFAAGLLVLPGAALHYSHLEVWRGVMVDTGAAETRLDGMSFDREPLWGSSKPGSSREAYESAAVELQHLRDSSAQELDLRLSQPWDSQEIRALVGSPAAQASLALMRDGAHRRDVRPMGFPAFPHQGITRPFPPRELVFLAHHQARVLSADGHHLEAARWMLDSAQMGLDCAYSPLFLDRAMGFALLQFAFQQPGEQGVSVEFLGVEGLALLQDALETLQDGLRASRTTGDAEFASFTRKVDAALPGLWPNPLGSYLTYARASKLSAPLHQMYSELEGAFSISDQAGDQAVANWQTDAHPEEVVRIASTFQSLAKSKALTLAHLARVEATVAEALESQR